VADQGQGREIKTGVSCCGRGRSQQSLGSFFHRFILQSTYVHSVAQLKTQIYQGCKMVYVGICIQKIQF
jgi:hypothetical protein